MVIYRCRDFAPLFKNIVLRRILSFDIQCSGNDIFPLSSHSFRLIQTNFNSLTPKSAKKQNSRKPKFHFVTIEEQMVPCKRTAREVSFE